MTVPLPTLAVLLVVTVLGVEFLKLTAAHVFGRFVRPGFVKISDCEICGKKAASTDQVLKNDVRAIKRVLFSLATNGKASEEDLKNLMT